METKESKITEVLQNVGTYKGKHGQIYKHKIQFENGDAGEYHSKSEDCTKFVMGETVKYTIEKKVNGQYTNVFIKPFTENTFTGYNKSGGKQKNDRNTQILIVYQNALTNAVNYCNSPNNALPVSKEQITATAEYFAEFVLKNKYLTKDA